MSTDFGQWDRVASELRACREAQQETWGDLDNAMLGRYLADDVTPQERQRIEKELEQRPELRKLTDLVSDVLRDCEPLPAESNRPTVLPFSTPKPTFARWRRWAAVAAAACLLATVGYAGYAVISKGRVSPAPSQGALADATKTHAAPTNPLPAPPPADPDSTKPGFTVTNTVAFHPSTPGDAPLGNQFFGPDGAKDRDKKAAPIEHVAIVLADSCEQAARVYRKTGDLDMAEFSYKLAYNIRDWKFGSAAAPTVEARRKLGDVYQTALNMDDAPALPLKISPSGDVFPLVDRTNLRQVESSARQLRERLARPSFRDVRQSVVPVLVENLNEAKTPEAREQFGRALANLGSLGSAAKDAVPALDACLQKADLTPGARAAVRDAKERLENTAWPAATPAPPP